MEPSDENLTTSIAEAEMLGENRQPRQRVVLGAEALEDRTLPAGNVTAYVSGGILFVQGDNANNQIWLSALSEDTVAVTALQDTRVNGTWLPLTFSGVSLGWVINLGQGNDQVYISRTKGNIGVFINTGAGDDQVILNRAGHAGPTIIRSGSGNDNISLGTGRYVGDVLINAGGGNDRVYLSGVDILSDSQFDGGPGFDQLGLDRSRFRQSPLIQNFEQVFTALMPTAVDDHINVPNNGRITISVLANDLPIGGPLDPASVRIIQNPTQGSVSVNANGTITYVANSTVTSSTDSFTYTVRNQSGAESNVATVHLRLPVALQPPAPTISTTATNPTNLASIPFTVSFNKDVTGFTSGDISVTNGTVSGFTTVNPRTYQFNVAPTADGNVVINLPAGAASDNGGRASTAASYTITYDGTAPMVTLATSATSPTNTNPIPFTATFSENVTGFTASDITVTNGTVQNFSGSGTTYTFEVVPTNNGAVTVSIAANVAQDTAGNGNTAATPVTITYDGTAPTVTLATSATSPTNTNPIPFTATFSENVVNFTAGDILVTNGAVVNFVQVNAATYTFHVVPTTTGTVDVTIPAAVAEDAAGNGNTASNTVSINFTGNVVTPTISTTASDPTNLNPIPFSVNFNENVTGFTASDIVVTNGSVQNFTESGSSYTFGIVPAGDGPIVIDIPAGAATGTSGTPNSAATYVITYDGTAPTVTIDSTGSGQITGTANDANTITLVKLSIYNGTNYWDGTSFNSSTEIFFTATGTTSWSYSFSTTGTYTVHARATDDAGNVGDATATVIIS
jgi:hypothetical protein